jgi:aminoglycoside phosphotransferase (APT) family kinase protein
MPSDEVLASRAVLDEVNRDQNLRYRLERPLTGGMQSGAWLLSDDAGTAAVLKWSPDRAWADQIIRANSSVAVARRGAYPTPAWLAVGVTSGGLGYQLQEVVAGAPREHLSLSVAIALAEVIEMQAGLDPDPERSWSHYLNIWYRERWTSTVAAVRDVGGEDLVEACTRMLSTHDDPDLPEGDLVHGDFRLSNVLFVDDRVAGVVDIEAVGSGSRVFDYATALDSRSADDTAIAFLVDAAVRATRPGVLARCLVHVVLDLVLFVRDHPETLTSPAGRARELAQRVRLVSENL